MEMPRIEISEFDFTRLQGYAEPLVDTPATALTKVLNKLEGISSTASFAQPAHSQSAEAPGVYGPTNLPPLTHTKFLSGRIGERKPEKNTWDSMVQLGLRCLFEKYGTAQNVRTKSGANLLSGSKTDEGYKFIPDLDLSYQGVSAEDAAKILIRIARDLEVALVVNFVWRDKAQAYKPGVSGCINIK